MTGAIRRKSGIGLISLLDCPCRWLKTQDVGLI
jgi:hypothetical protein